MFNFTWIVYFTVILSVQSMKDLLVPNISAFLELLIKNNGRNHVESVITSGASTVCGQFLNNRLGCCKPQTTYLYNVEISKGKLLLRGPSAGTMKTLFPVKSYLKQHSHFFSMPLEQRFNSSNSVCRNFINGTLHVMGRSTTNNFFHVLNDNILPILSQIVLDSAYDPRFLMLPRFQLTGFQRDDPKESLQIMEVLNNIFDQSFTVQSAEGICFARVVWGNGARLIYNHLFTKLRHVSSDLLREMLYAIYRPAVPEEYGARSEFDRLPVDLSDDLRLNASLSVSSDRRQLATAMAARINFPGHKHSAPHAGHAHVPRHNPSVKVAARESPVVVAGNGSIGMAVGGEQALVQIAHSSTGTLHYRLLNIVIYSRGTTGAGRSIAGEDKLREALQRRGAHVVICCDFKKMTLSQQLALAYHADVIVGLHGAGLTNVMYAPQGVILIELKSLYGHALDLFAVATEARYGTHIQIDIKDYAISHGNRPIDAPMIARIINALQEVLTARRRLMAVDPSKPYLELLFTAPPADGTESDAGIISKQKEFQRNGEVVELRQHKGDIIMFPLVHHDEAASYNDSDSLPYYHSFLGPKLSEVAADCKRMSHFQAYWRYAQVDTKGACLPCGK